MGSNEPISDVYGRPTSTGKKGKKPKQQGDDLKGKTSIKRSARGSTKLKRGCGPATGPVKFKSVVKNIRFG